MKIYGIPNCGTVKKAKAWLEHEGVAFEAIDFRKEPPTKAMVKAWVGALGSKAMRNTSGGAYRALPEEKKTWDDDRWTDEFANDPMLIKRPIIEVDGQAVKVGFRGSDDQLKAELL